jgi:hypothetical protein
LRSFFLLGFTIEEFVGERGLVTAIHEAILWVSQASFVDTTLVLGPALELSFESLESIVPDHDTIGYFVVLKVGQASKIGTNRALATFTVVEWLKTDWARTFWFFRWV